MATPTRAEEHRRRRAAETPEERERRLSKERERRRKYRETDPEKTQAYMRSWCLQKKYGITLDDYNALLEAQGHRCAVCHTDTPGGMGRFHVDHCHDTDVVRGLLCFDCNTGIGKLKDSPAVVAQALKYLTQERKQAHGQET